jgi:hypothetical protein
VKDRFIKSISLTCAIWWDTKRRTNMTPQALALRLKWVRPKPAADKVGQTLRNLVISGGIIKGDPRVKAIASAAKELVEQRDRWLNAEGLIEAEKRKRTLTNLYNQRPTWLDLAHKKLDEAVFAAYGWKSELSDEEILEKLLALNLERARQ